MTTCRTCGFLEVPLDKVGKRVPRKDHTYNCEAPIEKPLLPISVTKHYNWRWPPNKLRMTPDDGESCPLYKKLI